MLLSGAHPCLEIAEFCVAQISADATRTNANMRLLPAADDEEDDDGSYVPLRLLDPMQRYRRPPWQLGRRVGAQLYLGCQVRG